MDKKKITLLSSDGETFEVDAAVAMVSTTIEHMVEFKCADDAIPLPSVTSRILVKAAYYMDIKGLLDLLSQNSCFENLADVSADVVPLTIQVRIPL
ncbi:hypothetical protein ZIOFF_055725 [Zingiber officinale]|uniref:SKP1 component POZ domain-containing protein n=1 Tax=Zingiber officinale TaxID=94328 RepID=A0A8J5KEV9_ZINOF|nr:hypothetical protein ZIOFF_055725 [Zingiber officinale]